MGTPAKIATRLSLGRKFRFALKVVAVLVAGITVWRVTLPSTVTSPQTLESFNRKIAEIKLANKSGRHVRVAFSGIELSSGLEDWYRRERPDDGWPFRGTAFRLKGNHAHIYVPFYKLTDFRIILVDMRVDARGKMIDQRPVLVWIGIVPIPCQLFEWGSRAFADGHLPGDFWRSEELGYPIRDLRIANGELIVEAP